MALTVVRKLVGREPEIAIMPEGLEAMQTAVGGYIECVRLPHKIDMWLNEEGALIDLPLNLITYVGGKEVHQIMGNIFFTSNDSEGNTVSLNDEQTKWIMLRLFKNGVIVHDEEFFTVYGLIVK